MGLLCRWLGGKDSIEEIGILRYDERPAKVSSTSCHFMVNGRGKHARRVQATEEG